MYSLIRPFTILLGAAGIIHALYELLIRPRAEAIVEASRLAGKAVPRDVVVILMDWEQEICLILMVFCIVQIVARIWALNSEQYLFQVDVFEESDEQGGQLTDALDALEDLPEELDGTQLVSALKASLRRYRITGDIQTTTAAVGASVDALAIRFEADNSMIRYMIWAIPSIGFVGTVRGIGQALARADEALAGNIAGMTASLGTAFNSTMVALLASLVLMLLLHTLQRVQDQRLVDIQDYCEEFLVKRISR